MMHDMMAKMKGGGCNQAEMREKMIGYLVEAEGQHD
jgi:hypothetical protein